MASWIKNDLVMIKHIYIVNSASRASNYGIGTYIRQLISCLDNNKLFRLTVIELYSLEKEFLIRTIDGIRYIYMPTYPNTSYFEDKKEIDRYYNAFMLLFSSSISLIEFNIFHLNYIHNSPLVTLLKSKIPNCRIVLTVHYFHWSFILNGDTTYFEKIIRKKKENITDNKEISVFVNYNKERKLFNEVDKVICLTQYACDLLLCEYEVKAKKIALIHNGLVDDAVLLSDDEKKDNKAKMGFGKDEQIVLFVGRLEEAKGIGFLLKSFHQVINKASNIRLLIVGDGDYNNCFQLCDEIWGHVTFTGKLEKKQLYQLYQIADIGILPSFHEQCSFVAIEMMMHGLPLIISDATGTSEMIDNEKNGYKLKLEVLDSVVSLDVEDISNAIIKLLQDPKREYWKQSSRMFFEKNYSSILINEKTNAVYESMCNNID